MVVLTKSISNIWLRTGTTSKESGTAVILIIEEDAPSTFDIVVMFTLPTVILPAV